ncbi:MAG: Holliday junction branch migration protein RuvA [Candidatus Egerieousia sp.]|nr:Holliday junction branch migration protein RuvA [bacterium]MDY2650686.1 Holliday junction branch migration protein RuvA [Candidatus Egerieousia sp.]MDY3134373.1 Holliday junction branch migration protein RuvA [Candidatus Egerieousia sp.]MDY3294003.1 Holliday junction branch migration protein RuvA [Candidatus Egerieousia sp.]
MYDYIKGTLEESTPTEAVIENNGIGYSLQISLQTYTAIQGCKDVRLYIYHHLREDTELFFGFYSKEERSLFLLLIGVNGIGPNTARMMLSSLSCQELTNAILTGDVNKIKGVKGIGLKTAQRVIIDLKERVGKGDAKSALSLAEFGAASQIKEEALAALVMLGFSKAASEKAIDSILKEKPGSTIEELIKHSLKRL